MRHPRDLAAVLLALGLLGASPPALADEPVDEEIARLDAALARHPADVSLLITRAEHLVLAERAAAALPDLALAAALAPSDARVPAARAEALLALGRQEAALAEIDRAIGEGATLPRLLALRARTLASLERTEEAVIAWDLALARAPDPDGFLERAALLTSLGRDDDAIASLQEGLATTGAASVRVVLIERARALGRWETALAALEPLVGEGVPRWLLERGEILALAGRADDARRDFEAALALLAPRLSRRPTAAGHVDHARALLGLARLDEAELACRQALTRSPRYRPALDALAAVRAARASSPSTRLGGAR